MKQIERSKYKKALAIFNSNKRIHSPNQINLFLRAAGLNEKEISLFWQSLPETRLFLTLFESDQRFLHSNLDNYYED